MFYLFPLASFAVLVLSGPVCLGVPSPSSSADVVLGLWYSPDSTHLPQEALDLAGSSSSVLRVGTWKLTDASFVGSLCAASTRGVSVFVATLLPSSTTAAGWVQARRLVSSGGTVWSCSFPQRIANNFVTADNSYTLQGNYYFSATAVQAGSYLMAVSGTHTAAVANSTFATLISGGTLVVAGGEPRERSPGQVVTSADVRFTCFQLSQAAVLPAPPGGCTAVAGCGRSSQAFPVPPPPPPVLSSRARRLRPGVVVAVARLGVSVARCRAARLQRRAWRRGLRLGR